MILTKDSSYPLTIQKQIQFELQQLKSDMKLDFVAVALADANYREIYWKIALGAKSERYRKIMVRMGRGMAGKVLKAKSPHIITYFPEEVRDEMLEYPIFLVESLRSGVGVSIDSSLPEQKLSYGVLLVGQREDRVFNQHEVEQIEKYAFVLATLYDNTSSTFVSKKETNEVEKDLMSPLLQRLQVLHKEGVICELLDQRITSLSYNRQLEIAEILELLAHDFSCSGSNTMITIEQDEIGNTLVMYAGEGNYCLSHEVFNSMKDLLKSLKSDLELSVEQHRQFVRFTVPTRQLLDEIHWNV